MNGANAMRNVKTGLVGMLVATAVFVDMLCSVLQ